MVFQAGVYHSGGVVSIFEDKSVHSLYPEHQSWTVPEGFHFFLNCRCPQCNDTFSCIATYLPEVGRLINSHVMEVAKLKDSFDGELGFITRSSWIITYFEKKTFDKPFAQKTVLACIKCYQDLKQARKTRRLPNETFREEVNEGILDVFRNLIPQLRTEKEFCGLVKGAYLFTLIHMGDRIFHLRNLEPTITPFSFSKLQQELRPIVDTLSYEMKKKCLAIGILSVNRAYKLITSSSITVPKWVGAYIKPSSRSRSR